MPENQPARTLSEDGAAELQNGAPQIALEPRQIPLLPAILALVIAGAVLLIGAQFMSLYHTHANTPAVVGSGSVGSAHAWTPIPIALIAVLLGGAVVVSRNRSSLVGVGVLGLASLVIALTRDLSAARSRGTESLGGHYVPVSNTVAPGLYVEIAGALLLLIACVGGFLLWAPERAATDGIQHTKKS